MFDSAQTPPRHDGKLRPTAFRTKGVVMVHALAGGPSEANWFGSARLRLERLFAGPMKADRRFGSEAPAADSPLPDRPCVLVVDDNPVNLLVASETLAQWGITPMLAADGAEAVALACGHDFDLILMDLQMPVLDGLAATVQIRRFEREHSTPRTPVVAYTMTAFSVNEPRLRASGLDAVLDKPCDSGTLQACLLRWCPPGKCIGLGSPGLASLD